MVAMFGPELRDLTFETDGDRITAKTEWAFIPPFLSNVFLGFGRSYEEALIDLRRCLQEQGVYDDPPFARLYG